jgi:hypothetical protein
MIKYKAIAIPVSFADEKPKFLTVRDKRFKEWIFVTGGCRRREIYNPLRCALRELEEETRGSVVLKNGEYTHFKFMAKENSSIDLEYNVYIFFVNYSKHEQSALINKFNEEKERTILKKIQKKPYKKTFDENDFMSFDTLEEFTNRKRWSLISDNILKNPEFYACVTSLNRKTFAIK